MKYETPELTVLTSAISAVQSTLENKVSVGELDHVDPTYMPEIAGAYQDWE
jgi:hypothetical protein